LRHNPRHSDAHRQLGLALLAEGRPALALPQFRAVLKERPADAQAYFELGRCLAQLAQYDAAIAAYRDALRLRADWPEASNQLAWLLATAPDAALRDGEEAARIAAIAVKVAQRREPLLLDTLAAAQAEAGRFGEARETQQKAIVLADAIGDARLKAEFVKHLAHYQKNEPYRETTAPPGPGGPKPPAARK
jgi:tetratricopeptide (TPR) repeat protein